jgi:hypothetical protein
MAEESDAVELPLELVGADDLPIIYANNFIIQQQRHEFILIVGQVAPPVVLGTEAQQREQVARIKAVPVKALARFAMTPDRLEALIRILEAHLQRYKARAPYIGEEE